MNVAALIIIGLCAMAVAVTVALAFQAAERHRWVSPYAIAAIAAAMLITILAVWAVWTSFDELDAGAAPEPVGRAGNAGPRVANGNCDPLCMLAALGRGSGVAF
jgi:hypothetical protein